VLSSDNGFFLFSFDSVEHESAILECALWHMANRHLVLRRWIPNMQFYKVDLSRILIWIKLHHVPLDIGLIRG
jgi:hypothetical protein